MLPARHDDDDDDDDEQYFESTFPIFQVACWFLTRQQEVFHIRFPQINLTFFYHLDHFIGNKRDESHLLPGHVIMMNGIEQTTVDTICFSA